MDLDLAREILKRLDAVPGPAPALEARDPATVESHITHLEQAGLVARDGSRVRLSVSGVEFLRLASNDVLWRRVLGELTARGATPSLEAVKARMLEWSFMS